MPVQDIHQRKSDGRETETVDCVQHGIPMGHAYIKLVDFPQDGRRENKAQQEDFQGARQLHPQLSGNNTGKQQQEEGNRRNEN